jgi:hypothetical protein
MEKKEMYSSTAYGGTWLFIRILLVISIMTLLINFLY